MLARTYRHSLQAYRIPGRKLTIIGESRQSCAQQATTSNAPQSITQHANPSQLTQWRGYAAQHGRRVKAVGQRHKSPHASPRKSKKSQEHVRSIDEIMQPVEREMIPIEPSDCAEPLLKSDVSLVLAKFTRRPQVRETAKEHGISDLLYPKAFKEFRWVCMEAVYISDDLRMTLADIINGSGHVDDLFPHFLAHSRRVFPHLECLDDLNVVSDMREPHDWFPNARSLSRRIIFHAGPTNSGKTYHALKRFNESTSGVFCGPLKLLASEVFTKTNKAGTPCDLVTGEERKYSIDEDSPADHVSCTVEMVHTANHYEVAVIDEIQMMRDKQRGWAWTRALLGVCADEVHVCGEPAAIPLVRELAASCGDEFIVNHYERKSPLIVADKALGNYNKIEKGDCIVCFSKKAIFDVSRTVEKHGHKVAVIYGSLPPNTKLAMAAKFNSKKDPCNVLVATDAIGMGLNLTIKRVIFDTMVKPTGDGSVAVLTVSQAKQIAGRAGRFRTAYKEGIATTLREDDLPLLQRLMSTDADDDQKAGLHPTFEQIELFSYHLPHATLATLLDVFATLATMGDDRYFLCQLDDMRECAELIEHIQMPLKARYTFCLAPIALNNTLLASHFVRIARRFSTGEPLTLDWLLGNIDWPPKRPKTIADLVVLETHFDVLDVYLWLGIRHSDMFPEMDSVRDMQADLDDCIAEGVSRITSLDVGDNSGVVSKAAREIQGDKIGRGRSTLTSRLLADGLITSEQMDELRKELIGDEPSLPVKSRTTVKDRTSDRGGRTIKNMITSTIKKTGVKNKPF